MIEFEKLLENSVMDNGIKIVKIRKLKEIFPIVHEIEDRCFLFIKEEESWVTYALMRFNCGDVKSNDDDEYEVVFHGGGTGGVLREMRHTHWGEDGYTFYLPGNAVIKALTILAKYFDMD